MTAHDHQDVVYREFPGGLVLANPSKRGFRFHLPDPPAGGHYRRIPGTPEQDPGANNGRPVRGRTLWVPGMDARFLSLGTEERRP